MAKVLTDWQLLRPYLKMSESDEDDLIKSYPGNNALQKQKLLLRWRKNSGEAATHRALVTAIFDTDNVDLAWKVCQMAKESSGEVAHTLSSSFMDASTPPSAMAVSSSSASPPATATPSPAVATAAPSPAMLEYRNQLRRGYRTHKPVMVVEWPPPPALKYISLAMIRKKTVGRGNITSKYICAAIHGNMDSILHEKVPVEVDQLFSLGSKGQRQVILVEGAPGSGKSTLLWHICQKWQSGELFQQFSLVLLVLLRDTAIHTAQSLADILPCVPSRSSKYTPSEYRKAIASDIEDRHGEGVLIMLDGWDEAPADLQQKGSLIHDIIAEPSKCSVEAAAVIVSSRPSASHGIRKYTSTRVEVIGFTRERREEYVREALQDEPETAHSLLRQIKSDPRLSQNCHLPLNLVIITHTFLCSGNTLPSTYCRIIITLALSRLLRHIQKSTAHGTAVQSLESFSGLPDGIREEFLKLCKLAYEGVVKEKYSFSSEDLREITQSSATGVPQITTFGLLQAVHSLVATGSSTVYHFLHLSLQELCAAHHIASLPRPETEHVRTLKRMVARRSTYYDGLRYVLREHFQSVCEFYSALTNLRNPQVVSQLLHIYKNEDQENRGWHCAIECHGASLATDSFFKCLAEADNPDLTAKIAAEIIGTSVKIRSPGRALASVLSLAPHLKSVSCESFPPALSKALSGKTSLKHLEIDISYCIDMEHVKHVLRTCPNLERLDVMVGFRNTEVYHLADVSNQTSIQTLDLSGRKTACAGIIALSSALKTNTTIQHLTILHCKDVGPCGQEALVAALSQNTSLTTLEIKPLEDSGPFTEDDRTFFGGLKEIPSLTKFSMYMPYHRRLYLPLPLPSIDYFTYPLIHTYVGRTLLSGDLVELADILKLNRPPAVDKQIQIDLYNVVRMRVDFKNMCFVHLKFPDERHCEIGSEGIKQLMECLTKVAVMELNLSYHRIGDTGATTLAKVMGMKKLNISYCGIGEEGMVALSSALKTNTTLKCLNACGNQFGDKGAFHLAEALSHTSLEEIDISHCGIGEEGMVALSSALNTNTTLKCLNACKNDFGDKGAFHLAEALSHTSLQEIDISHCGIGEEGMVALSSALKTSTTLKCLNACGSHFGDKGAFHLAEALSHTSLQEIDISHCGIGEEGMVALSSALKTNATLKQLDISGNNSGGEGLSSALSNNTSLTHLKVSLGRISDHSRAALARAILQNKTLTSLTDNNVFTCEVTQDLLKNISTFYTSIKRSPIIQGISIDKTSSLGEALWSGNMEKAAEILELNQPPAVEKTLKIEMSNNTWEVDYGARTVRETDKGLLRVRSIYNDPTSWSSLRELSLGGMVLGGVGACLLAEMLNDTQIQTLDIHYCRIPEDGIVALSQALSTNATLKHLDIEGNDNNQRGQEALARAMLQNTTLTSLKTTSRWSHPELHVFTREVTRELLKDTSTFYASIKRSPIVQHISIDKTSSLGEALWSGNMEEAVEILELNQPPAVEKTLHIRMSNNTWEVDYGARKVRETGKGLLKVRSIYNDPASWSSLHELRLDNIFLGGVGACLLAEMLNETQIQKLDITCCGIPEDGIVALSQALSTNTTLKCLKACKNDLGDKGAFHLAEPLSHTSLQEIDISYCGIGEEGMATLSSALKTNATLKCLNTCGNHFGDKGAFHLAEALSHTSLQEIDISDCGIEEEGMVALSLALKTNTTLEQLDISENNGGGESIIALSSALSNNTTLKQLDISKNKSGGEGIIALSSALSNNTTLTRLKVSLYLKRISGCSRVALARAILQNTTLTSLTDGWGSRPHVFTREVTRELLKDTSTFYASIKRSPIIQCISIDKTSSLGEALWSGNMEEAAEILELNQPPAVEKTLHIRMSNNTWEVDYGARKVRETDEGLLKVCSIYNDPTSWSSLRELRLGGMVLGGVGARLLAEMLNKTQIQKLDITHCRIPEDGIVALSLALSTNTTLKHLAIGGNRINKRGQEALARALTRNTTLAVLDISNHGTSVWSPSFQMSFEDNGKILFQSLNQFSLSTIVNDRLTSPGKESAGWHGKIIDWGNY